MAQNPHVFCRIEHCCVRCWRSIAELECACDPSCLSGEEIETLWRSATRALAGITETAA